MSQSDTSTHLLNTCKDDDSTTFPGQPISMHNNTFGEEFLLIPSLNSCINKFADDNKPRSAIDSFEGQDLQRDLNVLEHWVLINGMKFKKSKYQILNLGWRGALGCVSLPRWCIHTGTGLLERCLILKACCCLRAV